jgi:hypothetical protein
MPPHDPPVEEPLVWREVDGFVPRRKLFCPRPEVHLPIRVTARRGIDIASLTFIVDTGSDVTMIPEWAARKYQIVGYDPSAVVVGTGTSFHGTLGGKWGHVSTAIGSRQLQLPSFYYADILPASGWFPLWFTRWLRGGGAGGGPFVLGRAGLFPLTSLLIERGRVCLSEQPFR